MGKEKDGWKNKLYFGDNLTILREHVPSESVDLIYLDPPFNSNATYNVLFGQHKGDEAGAQITAFEDTWHWGIEAEAARELVDTAPPKLVELAQALRGFLGQSDMMAYLCMMALRLGELHRVLKPTGSLYLHCDPTASHYLKLVLDGIFGVQNYRNEITWKRTFAHGNVGRNYGAVADIIFFYSKSDQYSWTQPFKQLSEEELSKKYPFVDTDGRRWQSVTLRNPGHRPNLHFPFTASNGIPYQPHPNGWSCNRERLEKYDREGRLHFPSKANGALRLKMYADESAGEKLQNIWSDIPPISANAAERLGYPTQKPEALLERIILASCPEYGLVLDPFCGCGTTVAVAERLHRRWIGIDITHLAIALMKSRLQDAFGYDLSPFEVEGVPKDLGSARELAKQDRYHFEWWALSLVNARPGQDKKKGADTGVDGLIYFYDDESGTAKKAVVQVKSGHVTSAQIRDLKGVMEREKAKVALFVTLEEPTEPMNKEAATAGFYEPEHWQGRGVPRLQILTVAELLEGKRPELPRYAPEATFKRAERKTKGPDGNAQVFSSAPSHAPRSFSSLSLDFPLISLH